MDQKPRADEELIKITRNGDESSSSGANPSSQYHEIQSSFGGSFSLPCESDKGFMDLLGIQEYPYGSSGYSLFDLLQPPLPPPPHLEPPSQPSELQSQPHPIPSPGLAAPQSSDVMNNQTPTPADSSSLSLSSNEEGLTSKAAGEEGEEVEHGNDQEKTKKLWVLRKCDLAVFDFLF